MMIPFEEREREREREREKNRECVVLFVCLFVLFRYIVFVCYDCISVFLSDELKKRPPRPRLVSVVSGSF